MQIEERKKIGYYPGCAITMGSSSEEYGTAAAATTTIQTHNYYTDTQLLYRHTTTIQTHNYYTDTQLLYRRG